MDSSRDHREADRRASEADQTASESDQTLSDTDQTISDRDQGLAEADQRSSDRDQALADRQQAELMPGEAAQSAFEASRRERGAGTIERMETAVSRAQLTTDRDLAANDRDQNASRRDRTADERDRVADALDEQAERIAAQVGPGLDPRAARALEAATIARREAAVARTRAAADRERAARDRAAAATDRGHLIAELERAGIDDLTGAYQRGFGSLALNNELERAQRAGVEVAVIFLDVDRLKGTNDRAGHAAGDELLRELTAALKATLRPYDPVVRWGGDEFVCLLAGVDLELARRRAEQVEALVAKATPGASISFGIAIASPGETLEDVLIRADEQLMEAKRESSSGR